MVFSVLYTLIEPEPLDDQNPVARLPDSHRRLSLTLGSPVIQQRPELASRTVCESFTECCRKQQRSRQATYVAIRGWNAPAAASHSSPARARSQDHAAKGDSISFARTVEPTGEASDTLMARL